MSNTYELFSNSVSCLCRDIRKLEQIEMEKYGLKGPHAQCLLSLSRYPDGLTATQLCELCGKDKAAVSRTVAELEESGLVRRLEVNGSRYRAPLILTEKGKSAASAVRERAKMAVDLAGYGVKAKERDVFFRVLTTLSDNLHEICRGGLK